ncbi:thioredoxin-2-like [Vespa mandarinia]|uniref:thioredoxin-2-like n=1 Tax=Vespa mandarinia TaxID=7446 RepID=UPI0016184164|nr:thioredoxin-2-like [Vespa mandarinia]
MVEHVQDYADLERKLEKAGSTLVVIDFYAIWCGPCKAIGPKIEELAKEREDVIFLKVNVEECEDIVNKYKITNMPTFVFIKEGKVLETFSGANYELLLSTIQTHK